jgi:hypothetical protein
MRANEAKAPRGIITELRGVLDALPADEPRHDLRQSLPLLVPLVEQMHPRVQPWSPEVVEERRWRVRPAGRRMGHIPQLRCDSHSRIADATPQPLGILLRHRLRALPSSNGRRVSLRFWTAPRGEGFPLIPAWPEPSETQTFNQVDAWRRPHLCRHTHQPFACPV